MIDKKLIKKAIEEKSCRGLQYCSSCPVKMGFMHWNEDLETLNDRTIRIMQEWLDKQED